MADVKTTDESPAAPLTGAEVIRAVQSGGNVKVTLTEIKTFVGSGLTFPQVFAISSLRL